MPYFFNCQTAWGCLHRPFNKDLQAFIYRLTIDYCQFPSMTATSSSSAGSATDTSVSQIAEVCASIHQPVPISPILTATSCRTNLLSPSIVSNGSDIPIRLCEASTMKPEDTIGNSNVSSAPLLLDLYWPGRVTLESTLLGTSWSTGLLQGSNLLISSCSVCKSRKCILSIIVVSELHLSPISRASFKLLLHFPVTTSFSQTARKFSLLMFLHAGYLPHKLPLLI